MTTAVELLRLAASDLLPAWPDAHALAVRAIDRGTPLQVEELRALPAAELRAVAEAFDVRRILVTHADAARALDPKSEINAVLATAAVTLRAVLALLPARLLH